MPRNIPEQVRRIQPPEVKEIGSDTLHLFNLWSEKDAEDFFATFELPFPEYYPIGSFTCGDVIGWLPGGGLFVMEHEELQVARSSLCFDEIMPRVLSADPSVEETVYASCVQPGPELYATLREPDAQSQESVVWFRTVEQIIRREHRTPSDERADNPEQA
jgi:hypothetical protein